MRQPKIQFPAAAFLESSSSYPLLLVLSPGYREDKFTPSASGNWQSILLLLSEKWEFVKKPMVDPWLIALQQTVPSHYKQQWAKSGCFGGNTVI